MLKKLFRLNRFLLLLLLGYTLMMATTAAFFLLNLPAIRENFGDFKISFIASLVEDMVFFSVLGLAISFAPFSVTGGDVLYTRLQRLFGKRNLDNDLVTYFMGLIRRNAIYSEHSAHKITILEYLPELYAYRVAFENQYDLHNAFGDVPYAEDISLEIVPDLCKEGIKPLAQVSKIEIQSDAGLTDELRSKPQEIGINGFKKVVTLKCKPDQKIRYLTHWWSYASNVGDSGFSIKRFSKRFTIEVTNQSQYTARIRYGDKRQSVATLQYGESIFLEDLSNVPERTRLEFSWLPPVEHDQIDPDLTPGERASILEFDARYGEKRYGAL